MQPLTQAMTAGPKAVMASPAVLPPRSAFCRWLFALAFLALLTAGGVQAQLIHRYNFNADATDSVGGANATLVNNATVTGGALSLNALGSVSGVRVNSGDNTGPYATLPGTVLQGLTNMTIEFWVSAGTALTADAGVWSRVYDFGNSVNGSGQNYVYFTPHDGNTTSRAGINHNGEYIASHYAALDDGQAHHVVVVYDAVGGWVEYYIDGTLAGDGSITFGRAKAPVSLTDIMTNNLYLGRSQYNGDAYLLGNLDEFRVWNRALSGAEAMANQMAGPDNPAINLSALGNLTYINIADPGTIYEKTNSNTEVTGYFDNSAYPLNLLHLPGFTFTSSDPTILSVDASGNLKALKPGSVTLTASYASQVGTLPVTVSADTTLPVLTLATKGYDRVLQITSSKPLDPVTATALSTYSIDGGTIAINSASLSTNGLVVTLNTAPFNVAAAHTLAVTGLKDTVFTPNVVNGSYPFGSVIGSVTRKVWRTGAPTLAAFQAFPTYPTHPDEIYNLPTANTPAANGDNFEDMLEGYIVPDTTGDYVFAVASDDDSALYLSTDNTVANLGATPIANVVGAVVSLKFTQSANQQSSLTTPPHLLAGSKYYFRAIHRDGTGNDFLQIAMQLVNGLPAPQIPDNTPVIQGANLAPYFDTPVALAITAQPAVSQTIVQSRPVSFTVAASGIPSYTGIQWYRNSQPIAGANGLTYTLAHVALTNEADTFYAVVSNLAYSVTSGNAVLHVTTDSTPPTLVSATTKLGSSVDVTFNEAMDSTSALNVANYAIAGETITNATLDATGTIVTLYVTPKITTSFGVVVNNVQDYAGNPIAPNSGINGVVLGVTPGMIAYWPMDTIAGGKSPDVVSGYDMTAVNMSETNVVPGKWGSAVQFYASAQDLFKHVFAAGDPLPAYNKQAAAHTISLWVNGATSTASENDRRFFCESTTLATAPLCGFGTSRTAGSDKMELYVRNDTGAVAVDHVASTASVFNSAWHHICLVQTASNTPVKIYIDGVLDALTYTPNYPMSDIVTTIGGIQRTSASAWFSGLIDDVAIWNRALAPEEVTYLATHVTPTPPPVVQPLVINSFDVNLPAVQVGGSITLSWDVSKDADTVDIQPGIGSVLGQTVLGAGTLTVPVTTSMTYTITVKRGVETKTAQVSVAAIGGVASGWTLLENFDRYAVGNLGSPWLVGNAGLSVVDVGGNRLLAVNAGGALTGLPLGLYTVKEGAVATLFFRLYVSQALAIGQVDELIGLTDKGIRSWSDYPGDTGPGVRIQNLTGDPQIGTQYGYGSTLEFAIDPSLLVTNVYNVWIDITNDVIVNGDLVTIYAAKDGDPNRTVLFQDYRSDRNPNDGTILGPTGPDLKNLVVGGNTSGSLIYLDDFYLSLSNYNATVPRAYGFTTPVGLVVTPPLIKAVHTGGSIVISWLTAEATGYALKSATSLNNNPVWTPVNLPVTLVGNTSTVTIPMDKAQEFYRLSK